MHRWTRLFIVAVTALLTVICLTSLLQTSTITTSKYAAGIKDGFQDATTGWGDWSWLGSSMENWKVMYQTEKEKEANGGNGRWRDEGQNGDGESESQEDVDGRERQAPTWLDNVIKGMKELEMSTTMSTVTRTRKPPAATTTTSDSALGAILSAIDEQKTKERTVTVTAGAIFYTPTDTPPIPDLQQSFEVPKNMVFNSSGPSPSQVVLVTASDGGGHNNNIENVLSLASENRKAYCRHHGYKCHYVDISKFDLGTAHPVWKKIPAIIEAFNTYPDAQWLFFLDLDAIIMSPHQDLNSLLLSHEGMMRALDLGAEVRTSGGAASGYRMEEKPDLDSMDLLIAQDHNGLNAGSFFLRRSEWTKMMLDLMTDPFFVGADWEGKEQETLAHLYKHHSTFRARVGILKMRTANAYAIGGEMGWQKGDLVVHFAGCWVNNECQQRWTQYWDQREVLTENDKQGP